MEQLAEKSKDQKDWEDNVGSELKITDSDKLKSFVSSWLKDENFRKFFVQEYMRPKEERLSDGADLGLY